MCLLLCARCVWCCWCCALVSIVEMLCGRPWLIYPTDVAQDRTRNVTKVYVVVLGKPTDEAKGLESTRPQGN